MTRGSSLGGDENVGDELRDLVVRYGELRDEKKERRGGLELRAKCGIWLRQGTTRDMYRWS